MTSILTRRIAFVASITGAFGAVIIKLIEVKNASFLISSVALLFSLIASFVISLILLPKLNARRRNVLTLLSGFLLIASIASFYLFQKNFIRSTVMISQFHNDTILQEKYFKGSQYTAQAAKLVKLRPELKDDDNALLAMLENKYENVWVTNSVRNTELNLSMWYIVFVIIVVSAISLTTEVLTLQQKQKTALKRRARTKIITKDETTRQKT